MWLTGTSETGTNRLEVTEIHSVELKQRVMKQQFR